MMPAQSPKRNPNKNTNKIKFVVTKEDKNTPIDKIHEQIKQMSLYPNLFPIKTPKGTVMQIERKNIGKTKLIYP